MSAFARALRARIAVEPHRRLLAWALVAAVLTAGPVALTLQRASSYSAHVVAVGAQVPGLPPIGIDDVRALLSDPGTRVAIAEDAGLRALPAVVDGVRVSPGDLPGDYDVAATAATPERARALAGAAGVRLAAASAGQVGAIAIRDLTRLRALPPAHGGAAAARARRIAALTRALPPSPARLVLGPRPGDPPIARRADRFVQRLPGAFPPRPAPAAAGLTGLALAFTLWLLAVARRPLPAPQPRPAPRAPGPGAPRTPR